MKKIALLITLSFGVMACKKVTTNVTNYQVSNYVSDIPLYSVKIVGDTLIADAENVTYKYIKTSNSEYTSRFIFWKSTGLNTTWNSNVVSYFDKNVLYLKF